MANKRSAIRTIYLYLFTIIGLSLIISGMVRFIDLGLKTYVFTRADEPERISQNYYYRQPPITLSKLESLEVDIELTSDEKATVKSWIADYKKWEEEEAGIDYLASRRQREVSNNLAMLFVGIPLYLYHWRIIRKEKEIV